MQIDGFKIGGFANISDVHLKIGEVNALIAPNGYGKSNVLRAIDFGIRFITAEDTERQQMMGNRWLPINTNMLGQDFSFGITGSLEMDGEEFIFAYDYSFAWAKAGGEGRILSESLKIKRSSDQRFRQMISRQQTDECLIVPSASGRCNKPFVVSASQLALSAIARSSMMYLYPIAKQVFGIRIPNLETLDNPESYFSAVQQDKDTSCWNVRWQIVPTERLIPQMACCTFQMPTEQSGTRLSADGLSSGGTAGQKTVLSSDFR